MGKSKREKQETDDTDVPKAKKVKTEDVEEEAVDEDADISLNDSRRWTDLPYDSKINFTSAIAKPMASKKLSKRLFKLIRKASKLSRKEHLRIGLKDVQLRIRKGETGLLVLAGDVTPIEVMCHLPAVCEEKNIPYVYVPLRADISTAVGIKRPALMVLIKHNKQYEELYNDCQTEIKLLPLPIS
ncbi:unnamed protein product [Oppiella nova]|uniref:Ribosomal protein eL8/eL30/eS12/Gadd45 domain-containing protein n=1 Tax=Oppiella nova TaxID=334625 RepID=A0A7R9LL46_9ACAR|nr:unnamed protein product [Oppiella nova]CAG2164723.1 unnamed protein product [Oppiella nova]